MSKNDKVPEEEKMIFLQCEKYLVVLNDQVTGDVFTVIAPSRIAYKEMIGLLPNRLFVRAIQVIESSVDFKEMITDLRKQQKPEGLQTGNILSQVLLQPVESSNIVGIGYGKREKELLVGFKSGSTYSYLNVPEEVYENLMKAESKGKFLASEIIKKYKAVKQ